MGRNGSLPDEPSERALAGPKRAREIDLAIARRLAAENGMTLVPKHMIETIHAEITVPTVSLLHLDNGQTLRHQLPTLLAHRIAGELHRANKLSITETAESADLTHFHAWLTLILPPDEPRNGQP